jgi:hypothetical protein
VSPSGRTPTCRWRCIPLNISDCRSAKLLLGKGTCANSTNDRLLLSSRLLARYIPHLLADNSPPDNALALSRKAWPSMTTTRTRYSRSQLSNIVPPRLGLENQAGTQHHPSTCASGPSSSIPPRFQGRRIVDSAKRCLELDRPKSLCWCRTRILGGCLLYPSTYYGHPGSRGIHQRALQLLR